MKQIRSLSLFHSLLFTHNILNTPLSLSLSLYHIRSVYLSHTLSNEKLECTSQMSKSSAKVSTTISIKNTFFKNKLFYFQNDFYKLWTDTI